MPDRGTATAMLVSWLPGPREPMDGRTILLCQAHIVVSGQVNEKCTSKAETQTDCISYTTCGCIGFNILWLIFDG